MNDRAVVDTNVLVAANGRATHADKACQLTCVDELARLAREEVVCIDNRWLIMREYERRTAPSGQPGLGTAFFKWVWQTMNDTNRVHIVEIEPVDEEGRDFTDPALPPNNLKKDAKFLAVAVKADAAVVNALDSDWDENRELTDGLGVEVRQLCPQHATRPKKSGGDHAVR